MPGPWVDSADADVIAAVTDGAEDVSSGQVEAALAEAQQLLEALTGYLVHPSGQATEEFTAVPFATRLTPTWRPLQAIIDVLAVRDCQTYDISTLWCAWQGVVVLSRRWALLANRGGGRAVWLACGCPDVESVRLTYRYGSTVTAAARAALLAYGRQLFLRDHPDLGDCQLPERVTSVSREGLSYTVFDPQTYLEQGRTGVPTVDMFIKAINPARALRPSAVYTPDAPPGVTVQPLRVVIPW